MQMPSRLVLALSLIGQCISSQAQAFESENEQGGGRSGFVYGGECSQLANLNRREITAVTHSVHADHFDRFCSTESIYSCSDYTAMLQGIGSLEENPNYGCSFIPGEK